MKNFLKLFGIIALVIIIGFTMTACPNDDDNGNNNNNNENGENGENDIGKDFGNKPPATPEPFKEITAFELISGIRAGWNLGNTLDPAHLHWFTNPTLAQFQTAWGNPLTTKEMIDEVKKAGFNGIRIPVTWGNKAGPAPDYKIREDWMTRVTEIVNYAVANNMYILLNTHHDEFAPFESFDDDGKKAYPNGDGLFRFSGTTSQINTSQEAFKKIWEQIADNFKNYDERLIFEGLNEPRTKGSAAEWNGGTQAEWTVLNDYYQIFVNAVRASGGNNGKRVLLINTYGASQENVAMNGLVLPTDTATNKLAVSYHNYAPYNFALNEKSPVITWSASNTADTNSITQPMDRFKQKFVDQGIPVIIGEYGAVLKEQKTAGAVSDHTVRAAWAKYYTEEATKRGIVCFYWDDGGLFELLKRSNRNWAYPAILQGIMDGTKDRAGSGGGGTPPVGGGGTTTSLGALVYGENHESPYQTYYHQAVWNSLTTSQRGEVKKTGAQLVIKFKVDPTVYLQLAWMDKANYNWKQEEILNGSGSPVAGNGGAWNSGTKTLTITLSNGINDYSSFITASDFVLILQIPEGSDIKTLIDTVSIFVP